MKRLCLVLAFLFLFSQTAFAMPLLIGQQVVYRGTITGLRISAVDGTAFIDNAGATIPTYADGNHQIEIYDSSNRMLRGVLKAAGSSETLGDELITNGNMETGDPPSGWSISSGSSLASAADERTGGAGAASIRVTRGTNNISAFQNLTVVAGILLKATAWLKNIDNVTANIGIQSTYAMGSGSANWNEVSLYSTPTSTTTAVRLLSANIQGKICAFDDVSAKQVLTPSSAGCTLQKSRTDTTESFNHKNASFFFDAASYYVIIRRLR